MAVSVRNLERFASQNPEHERLIEVVLRDARPQCQGNAISARVVKVFLGDLAVLFFRQVSVDPEHQRIGKEDCITFSVKKKKSNGH